MLDANLPANIFISALYFVSVLQCSIQRIRQNRMYDPTLGVASFALLIPLEVTHFYYLVVKQSSRKKFQELLTGLMRTVTNIQRQKRRCTMQHVHLNLFYGEQIELMKFSNKQLPFVECEVWNLPNTSCTHVKCVQHSQTVSAIIQMDAKSASLIILQIFYEVYIYYTVHNTATIKLKVAIYWHRARDKSGSTELLTF